MLEISNVTSSTSSHKHNFLQEHTFSCFQKYAETLSFTFISNYTNHHKIGQVCLKYLYLVDMGHNLHLRNTDQPFHPSV